MKRAATMSILIAAQGALAQVTWTKLSEEGPSPRCLFGMAYDQTRGETVLFGGWDYDKLDEVDTWAWRNGAWHLLATDGPPPMFEVGMAYDPIRGVTVLIGGIPHEGEHWQWDGTIWTPIDVEGMKPEIGCCPELAFDDALGEMLLYQSVPRDDDTCLGELWSWDGATWTLRSLAENWTVKTGAIAYDPSRDVVVLHGLSLSGSAETWEWDGTSWSLRSVEGPRPRWGHSMEYSEASGEVVLFGGQDDEAFGPPMSDVWAWDGHAWAEISAQGPERLARKGHAMTYDPRRDTFVVFGGYIDTFDMFGDTWELSLSCAPDVNGDGVLNVLDFVAFQTAWLAHEAGADCDQDGAWTVGDFVCFQTAFGAGCW